MGVFSILSVAFGGVALFAAGITPYAVHRERKLAREGVTATGTVVKVEVDSDAGYNALVEFTVSGVRHSFYASTRPDGYQPGDSVRVRYLPERPDEAAVDSGAGIYRRTIVAMAITVAFGVAACIMLVLRDYVGEK